MRKTISKAKVIKALQTEPLSQGSWRCHDAIGPYDNTCDVCAVGAVLRAAGVPENRISIEAPVRCRFATRSYFDPTIPKMLKGGFYLSALNCYFEAIKTKDRIPSAAQRKRLIAFVEKNFPDRVSLQDRSLSNE